MKRTVTPFVILFFTLLMLAACGSELEPSISAEASASTVERVRLDSDFANAAAIETQLAAGTLRLEESDLAVDETLAAELLPLWQAYQSLSASDTVAEAELAALLNQIQDTMQPEQVAFISDLAITDESLQEMMANGEIAAGRGAGRPGGGAPEGAAEAANAGGGQRPGGGGLGGGPGGGGPGGGGQGGDLGNLTDEERAELRAQRFGENPDIMGQTMTRAVTALLSVKTGAEVARPGGGGNNGQQLIVNAVAEALELDPDEIQTQLGDGSTLVDIIAENGGQAAAVREDVADALADSPLAESGNLEQMLDRVFGESE